MRTSCSLLIPCHNASKFLPILWESVEAQTISFDEVICYDDGSTDDTSDVARRLGATVIRSEVCKGAAHARNQLAAATNCSWFHFHDADDLLSPNYLEVSKSNVSSDVDVIICDADWVDAETRDLVIAFKYDNEALNQSPGDYVLSHPIGGINGLYRKDSFWKIGGFDESLRMWEDADLHVRLATSGAKILALEEVLVVALRYQHTASHNYSENWRYRLRALNNYANKETSLSRLEIANQAEIAAQNLLNAGDRSSALSAISLCSKLGGNPPTTDNFILRHSKRFIPIIWLIQVQNMIRTSVLLNRFLRK